MFRVSAVELIIQSNLRRKEAAMTAVGTKRRLGNVRFSNRRFRVKRFQTTIHNLATSEKCQERTLLHFRATSKLFSFN
jgi:hypothetical protein